MKLRRLAPLLALLLLAGCQSNVTQSPSPSSSPSLEPTPEATTQVTVHWDALSPQEDKALVSYFYDTALTEFAPADDYGALVPYIGGEMTVHYYEESESTYTSYLYGLCTADGRIVTAPVYRSVYQVSWYYSAGDSNGTLPVRVLTQVEQDEDGEYYNTAGLVALDGSWYTGMVFRAELSSTIAASPYSILMMESADAAVLISAEDGRELARYSPSDFLGDDPNGYASWFFSEGLSWGMLRTYDDWFYYDPEWLGLSGDPIWIDAATGEFLDQAPMEVPEYSYDPNHYTFSGGWYDPEADPLVIYYDDGTEETIDLPEDLGVIAGVSTQFLLFRDDDKAENILTDHQGNVLATGEVWLITDFVTGVQYPYLTEYLDEDWSDPRYTVLDPATGESLVTVKSYLSVADGLLVAADETSYRLVDLTSGGQDILRIPRWSALDLPSDD
jgi:hypothetical protein